MVRVEFSSFNAVIMGIQIPSVLVSWEIRETNQQLKDFSIVVNRGDFANDLKPISQKLPISENRFVDYGVILHDINKIYYYRIDIVGPKGELFSSKVFNNDEVSDPYSQSIIDDHQFLYRYISGTPVVIFQKRRSGIRCECWDSVLKRATTGMCKLCNGSTFIGGYSSAIEAWCEIGPDSKNGQMTDLREEQPSRNMMTLTNYPMINIGDIVIEVRTHQYWRVTGVPQQGEKNRSTLLQIIQISLLNRSDVEYNLKVPDDMRDRLLKQLSERTKVREF